MRFPIAVRMFAGFLAVIVLAGAAGIIAIGQLRHVDSILRELAEEEVLEAHALWKARAALSGLEIDLRHALVDPEAEEIRARIREKQTTIRDSLVTYQALHFMGRVQLKELFEEVTTDYQSFEEATTNVVTLLEQGKEGAAKALVLEALDGSYEAIVESLDRLLDEEYQEVGSVAAFAQAENRSDRKTITILVVAGALLGLALALGITLSLTRPITKLVETTERIAEGDLTSKVEIDTEDEIGRLARRFNEMVDRLNRSISDQRRFYADASHELRTPLTVIRGEAEVALRGPKSVRAHREALEHIIAGAGQMGVLVDELLFLARSEAGQVTYDMANVALAPLLEEVADRSEGLAALKGIRLNLDLGDSMVVRGDPQRLRQVFLSLVDNAIKYTDSGGTVALALDTEWDRARVTVSDTGAGIPEEELPHIFERFYRGKTAKAMREEGTGLGLSITESIVKAHRGKIVVDSAPGRGTTVSVTLPRHAGRG